MEFWSAQCVVVARLDLGMCDCPQILRVLNLIQSDLTRLRVLYVSETAVREPVPLDNQLAERVFDPLDDFQRQITISSHLASVDVDRKDCNKFDRAPTVSVFARPVKNK